MTRVALIDGDILVYQAGFASDKRWYVITDLDDGHREVARFEYKKDADAYMNAYPDKSLRMEKEIDHEPLENCLHSLNLMILNIADKVGADKDDINIFLTGKGKPLYREDKDPEYKANRDSSHKPFWSTEMRDYLIKRWYAKVTYGIEADDALGLRYYEYVATGKYEPIICSIDKDLLTIPATHYNWNKDEWYFISEIEGARNFWKQMLTGDSVDNIKGVPKIGKVKAAKLIDHLETIHDMEQAVMAAYQAAFSSDEWADEFSKNYYLLYILRSPDELDGMGDVYE